MVQRFESRELFKDYAMGVGAMFDGGNIALSGMCMVYMIDACEHDSDGLIFVIEAYKRKDDEWSYNLSDAQLALDRETGEFVFAEVYRDADEAFARYGRLIVEGAEALRNGP